MTDAISFTQTSQSSYYRENDFELSTYETDLQIMHKSRKLTITFIIFQVISTLFILFSHYFTQPWTDQNEWAFITLQVIGFTLLIGEVYGTNIFFYSIRSRIKYYHMISIPLNLIFIVYSLYLSIFQVRKTQFNLILVLTILGFIMWLISFVVKLICIHNLQKFFVVHNTTILQTFEKMEWRIRGGMNNYLKEIEKRLKMKKNNAIQGTMDQSIFDDHILSHNKSDQRKSSLIQNHNNVDILFDKPKRKGTD